MKNRPGQLLPLRSVALLVSLPSSSHVSSIHVESVVVVDVVCVVAWMDH